MNKKIQKKKITEIESSDHNITDVGQLHLHSVLNNI